MNSLRRYVERILSSHYLNYKIVLLIDLFVTVCCTLFACFIVCRLTDNTTVAASAFSLFIVSLLTALPAFFMFKTYRHVIRHSTLTDLWRIGFAVVFKDVLIFLFFLLFAFLNDINYGYLAIFILFDMMFAIIALVMIRMMMVKIYERFRAGGVPKSSKNLILIYGTSNMSASLVKRLNGSSKYNVAGFYVFGRELDSYYLAGLPVYYFRNQEDFNQFIPRKEIKGFLFAKYEDAQAEKDRLIVYCSHAGVKTFIAPPINEVGDGPLLKNELRQIKIEDLLGRDEIHINMELVTAQFKNKRVLVTGAAGSIGSELCRQLAMLGVRNLVLFDSAETPMHELRLEMERCFPYLNFLPIVGDVRVKQRVNMVFDRYRPEIVFHAAAYKHVPLMEENPCEAVLVNVVGTKQVADMAVMYGAEMMIMISTDKAVNPTNVMGCSKRLAEIYVQSLGKALGEGTLKGKTKFVTTRFGNVLGSNGSVIPHFRSQIERGGPVTVTHPDIIRYFMTIPEACRLVLEAATLGRGNDIFVFEMGEPVRIADLAKRMIELAGYVPDKDIQIEYTGLRPGEKLFEEMLSNEENTLDIGHEKIRVARVRDYDYEEIATVYADFESLSRAVRIEDTVRLMKKVVPEFVSKNSPRFEVLDDERVEGIGTFDATTTSGVTAISSADVLTV